MTLKYLIEYIGRKTIERSAMELTSVDDTGGITPENPNGLNLFHHQLVIRARWVAALRAERLPSFPQFKTAVRTIFWPEWHAFADVK